MIKNSFLSLSLAPPSFPIIMKALYLDLKKAIENEDLDKIRQLLAVMPPCVKEKETEFVYVHVFDGNDTQDIWASLFIRVAKHIHDADTIRLFLHHPGADVNHCHRWNSPIRSAILHSNMDVFKILLDDPRVTLFPHYEEERETETTDEDDFVSILILMMKCKSLEMMKYLFAARRLKDFWHSVSATQNLECALRNLDHGVGGTDFKGNYLHAKCYLGMYWLLRAMIDNPRVIR